MNTQKSKAITALQSIGCKRGENRPVLSSVYVHDGTAWATNGKTLLAVPCSDYPNGIWPTKQFTPSDNFPMKPNGSLDANYPNVKAVVPPVSSYRGEPVLITETMEHEVHTAGKDKAAYISWAVQSGVIKFHAKRASDLLTAIRRAGIKGALHIRLTSTYSDALTSPLVITGQGITHALICPFQAYVAVEIPWTAPVAQWEKK